MHHGSFFIDEEKTSIALQELTTMQKYCSKFITTIENTKQCIIINRQNFSSFLRPTSEFSGHVEAKFIIVIIGIFGQFYCQQTGKISKIARVYDLNF